MNRLSANVRRTQDGPFFAAPYVWLKLGEDSRPALPSERMRPYRSPFTWLIVFFLCRSFWCW